METTTMAFEAGRTDGAEWVRDSVREAKQNDETFETTDVERGLSPGRYSADEGLINALGTDKLFEVLGLPADTEWGGDAWRAALADYNAGFAAGARAEIEPTKAAIGETITYEVTNRDGFYTFTVEAEAVEFAKELASKGWIGDTIRVGRTVRHPDGQPAAEREIIWSRTRQ